MKEEKYAPLRLVDDVNSNLCEQFNIPYTTQSFGVFDSDDYVHGKVKDFITDIVSNSKVTRGKSPLEVNVIIENEYSKWIKTNDSAYLLWYLANEWRKNKQVFCMSQALAKDLMLTEDTGVNPDILKNMPCQTFYIDLNEKGKAFKECGNISGILVNVSNGKDNGVEYKALTLCIIDSAMRCVVFNLDKISDSIDKGLSEVFGSRMDASSKLAKTATKLATQVCLYLASTGAEIIENDEQREIYKESSEIKDKYREIRKWDVGRIYSNTSRAFSKVNDLTITKAKWEVYKDKPTDTYDSLRWIKPQLIGENE